MPLPQKLSLLLEDVALVARKPNLGFADVADRNRMLAIRWFKDYPPMTVKTLVDLGAHTGLFSSYASKCYPLERVVSVEPLPECAQACRELKLPNHTVVEAAISDSVGTTEFHINATAQSSSIRSITADSGEAFGLDMRETKTISVKVTTLDEVYKSCQLESVDLLKVDVQGLEREVLLGGGDALKKTKAVVMEVAIFQHYAGAATMAELHTLMEEHGFCLSRFLDGYYDNDHYMLQADLLYLRKAR